MSLNPIQVAHVNGVIRPFLETLVGAKDAMDTFVAEYDALQDGPNALPEDATIMLDGADGTVSRVDAPLMTGAIIKTIRDRAASMSAVITPTEFAILIDLMVRDLASVRR